MKNYKYKVEVLHPNSFRPIAKVRFFKTKDEMLSYVDEAKDWIVKVYEKVKGKWQYNEEDSYD
jgi:hypothetical protein